MVGGSGTMAGWFGASLPVAALRVAALRPTPPSCRWVGGVRLLGKVSAAGRNGEAGQRGRGREDAGTRVVNC